MEVIRDSKRLTRGFELFELAHQNFMFVVVSLF